MIPPSENSLFVFQKNYDPIYSILIDDGRVKIDRASVIDSIPLAMRSEEYRKSKINGFVRNNRNDLIILSTEYFEGQEVYRSPGNEVFFEDEIGELVGWLIPWSHAAGRRVFRICNYSMPEFEWREVKGLRVMGRAIRKLIDGKIVTEWSIDEASKYLRRQRRDYRGQPINPKRSLQFAGLVSELYPIGHESRQIVGRVKQVTTEIGDLI